MTTTTETTPKAQQQVPTMNVHTLTRISAAMFRLNRALHENDPAKSRSDVAAAWQTLQDLLDRTRVRVK